MLKEDKEEGKTDSIDPRKMFISDMISEIKSWGKDENNYNSYDGRKQRDI
jgi:hypothetical protein